jgi:hypothetical protein
MSLFSKGDRFERPRITHLIIPQLGEHTSPTSYKMQSYESPGKTMAKASPRQSLGGKSPEAPKLQGKIGALDANVIEEALSKLKGQVSALQEERKKKEEMLKKTSIASSELFDKDARITSTRT